MIGGLVRGSLAWALVLILAGCGSSPFKSSDSAPRKRLHPDRIADAVPRQDPITRAGNTSPYTVLGKTYHVLSDPSGHRERGTASWYGRKFHGRPTANGETYSVYGMTAAHRSLPIPCYVEVTNLENGRRTVVRVNDRGPFHGDRIIDLSYAAAVKLGFADKGTALVEIRLIEMDNGSLVAGGGRPSGSPPASVDPGRHYLQAGAFQDSERARQLKSRLAASVGHPVSIETVPGATTLYRVHIGPLTSRKQAEQLRGRLQAERLAEAHVVVR